MRFFRWSIPLVCALLLAAPVLAQSVSPIYLVVQGALMQFTPGADALDPVSACALSPGEAYYDAPVLSPGGALLALRIEPQLVSDARTRVGGWAGGEDPSDIAVCDPTHGLLVRLTQPDDAALFDESGRPDSYLVRSAPAWSPDSTALTWTESDTLAAPMTLQMLTLADGATHTLAELPPQYGVPVSLPVAWSTGPLIAVLSDRWDEAAQTDIVEVLGFDPATGAQAFAAALPQADVSYPVAHFWIDQAGEQRIAVLMSSGAWLAIDPATGAHILLEGAPELVSAAAPDGVAAVADAQAMQVDTLNWLARAGDSLTPLSPDVRGFVPPSIAPGGSAILFYDHLTPAIWRDGGIGYVPLPPISPNEPVYGVWGAGRWQVFTGELAPAETGFVCFGAPEPRLTIGGQAAVSEEFGDNNLRAEPSPEGELLGVIPAGSIIGVVDGPVCVSGYAWWQVTADGQTGWTAEGEGLNYWLEPAD